MAQGLSDSGEKSRPSALIVVPWVTARSSLATQAHPAVTTITESEMLHLISYMTVPGRKLRASCSAWITPDSRKGKLGSLETKLKIDVHQ